MNSLTNLGWNDEQDKAWGELSLERCIPARVVADYGSGLKIAIPEEKTAETSGRLQYFSEPHEMPKVGDWVAVQMVDDNHGIIHEVLPRKSEIGRRQPDEQLGKQILATNVDVAFLVQALDHDFSPERIQRYLFQLKNEGVEPIIILNKADKEADIESKLAELKEFDVKIIKASAIKNIGIDEIAAAILPGQTVVFLGSSGVGKSTITNALLGEEKQATQAIREEDSKGRHTTTHRELFVLPNGGMVIDTPGLRELQLWGTEDDLGASFSDIEDLATQCKFSNCGHNGEAGCAITSAIQDGTLEEARLAAYFKFQNELRFLKTKIDKGAAANRKKGHKKTQKSFNKVKRKKNGRKG